MNGRGALQTLELQRRDRTPENDAFTRLARFSLMRFSGGATVGDALRLKPTDTVVVIGEADELD